MLACTAATFCLVDTAVSGTDRGEAVLSARFMVHVSSERVLVIDKTFVGFHSAYRFS